MWSAHRIWPEQNPGPKPPLEAVVSEETLRAKVDDIVRGSRALEERWHRVITHDDLQREMARMTA
ncbi:MAG: hypothetical protein LAO51_15860 [Acidobacteriia bacterium]|nr:hypothetical protein [Terriglobia bacterium]